MGDTQGPHLTASTETDLKIERVRTDDHLFMMRGLNLPGPVRNDDREIHDKGQSRAHECLDRQNIGDINVSGRCESCGCVVGGDRDCKFGLVLVATIQRCVDRNLLFPRNADSLLWDCLLTRVMWTPAIDN